MNQMDVLLEQCALSRQRTLELLETVTSVGQDVRQVLGWRPGLDRAHIAWQLMHIAASDDRMLNFRFHGRDPADPELVRRFAYQSTPDDVIPGAAEIRSALEVNRQRLIEYLRTLSDDVLDRLPPGGEWTYRRALQELAWHEGHHHGQAKLTWNLYRALHGLEDAGSS